MTIGPWKFNGLRNSGLESYLRPTDFPRCSSDASHCSFLNSCGRLGTMSPFPGKPNLFHAAMTASGENRPRLNPEKAKRPAQHPEEAGAYRPVVDRIRCPLSGDAVRFRTILSLTATKASIH